MKILFENLRVLRKILKISQKQLAEEIGVDEITIGSIERTKTSRTKPIVIALAAYFSLRKKTAIYLNSLDFYKTDFALRIGFNEEYYKRNYENSSVRKNSDLFKYTGYLQRRFCEDL